MRFCFPFSVGVEYYLPSAGKSVFLTPSMAHFLDSKRPIITPKKKVLELISHMISFSPAHLTLGWWGTLTLPGSGLVCPPTTSALPVE